MADTIRKIDYFHNGSDAKARVGDDFILLRNETYWDGSDEPYLSDATNAIFFYTGTADISINMTDYHIVAPSMVILMEGMIVRQKSRSEDSLFDVIVISKSLTDTILSEGQISVQLHRKVFHDPVFTITGHRRVLRAFHFLLENIMSNEDNPYRLPACKNITLTLFYGFALSRQDVDEVKAVTRKDELTQTFVSLVRENYHEQRSVAFYADRMCVTPKYLSQVVKDSTGHPALDVIDEFTIVECKALLKSTDLTIDQISAKMGFQSASLFGKYFRRITGQSPRDYRKGL